VAGSEAVYLALPDVGKLLPRSESRPPDQETRESIRLAEELLTEREWSFHDVRRTWFYLHEILDWYGDFNCARNQEYDRMGLSPGASDEALPASTGIFAHNPRGAWCVFDLLAVRSPNGHPVDVHRLSNPRQSEAPEYGSAFSRGLTLTSERCRYLLVSGTASIDDQGRSVHMNDFESQTERTLDTVRALIEVGGGEIDDICQATAFIKRSNDISKLKSILARRGMDRLPVVYTVGDVCRDELLFELDATAVVSNRGA
jgi:enamine deaminase RidA (YjgF/YER057c/UK114 family)